MAHILNIEWLHFFGIWHWQDITEIIAFSSAIYFVARWLRRHTTQRLTLFFYGYLCILIGAYFLQLANLYTLFSICTPITFMLMMLKHSDMLQKHFVTPKKIIPAQRDTDWLEAIIQTSLITFNENKSLCFIVERASDISSYIDAPFMFKNLAHKELLHMLIQSSTFDNQKFIWLQSNGQLRAVNCEWKGCFASFLNPEEPESQSTFEQNSLVATKKTDAIAIHAQADFRTFSIILEGTIINNLSAHQCIEYIKKYLNMSINKAQRKSYEKKTTQKNDRQHSA